MNSGWTVLFFQPLKNIVKLFTGLPGSWPQICSHLFSSGCFQHFYKSLFFSNNSMIMCLGIVFFKVMLLEFSMFLGFLNLCISLNKDSFQQLLLQKFPCIDFFILSFGDPYYTNISSLSVVSQIFESFFIFLLYSFFLSVQVK